MHRQGADRDQAARLPLDSRTPVIVLNLFHTGLGIARCLAGTGVRVVGLSADRTAFGNCSRFCEVRRAPNSQEQPVELARFLVSLASDLGGAIIFATRDSDLLFLDRFRETLEPLFKLAIPPRDVLFRVLDKAVLAEVASQAGLKVPKTVVVGNTNGLTASARTVGFPCVIKPVRAVDWRWGNSWKLAGERKAFRADNMAELHDHYARVSKVKAEVLLQEWIPGGADRIGVWGGHVSASDSATYFTARKIVQSPEDFGTGCVVESDNIAELVVPSLRLCASLDYEGIAEIEYKHDPRDGEFKLIEINPRHWDWHQLGGVGESNITLAAYRHLTDQPRALAAKTELRRKWIAEDTFLTYTLQNFFDGNLSPGKVWRTVAGRRIYGMFCWSDPLPFLRYFGITLIPILCKRAARKVWRLVLTSGLTLSGHSKPFGDDALKPAPIPGDEVSFN